MISPAKELGVERAQVIDVYNETKVLRTHHVTDFVHILPLRRATAAIVDDTGMVPLLVGKPRERP